VYRQGEETATMSQIEKTRVDYVASIKRDVFNNYDKDVIPIMKDGDGIDVAINPMALYMDMDDKGILDMKVWLRVMWRDERLAWNPDEYGGIKMIRIPISQIWVPDVICFNSIGCDVRSMNHMFDKAQRKQNPAILRANGDVMIVTTNVQVKVQSHDEEFNAWPWGEYKAKIVLGSWTYTGNEIKIRAADEKWNIDNDNLNPNSPMAFTVNSFESDPFTSKDYGTGEDYLSLVYEFKVQRRYRMKEEGRENNPNPVPEYKPENQ